jgi:hypothetical protein
MWAFFLLSPLTKFGISQESEKSSNFANYRFQEIANTFGFTDEVLHLEFFFAKDSKDFEFGECHLPR